MLVGVLSDTHENMLFIARAVEYFNRAGVSFVFHAGDLITPLCATVLSGLHMPFVAVFGNNDSERAVWRKKIAPFGEIHDGPYAFEREGYAFLGMHAPLNIEHEAASQRYDVIMYGHTHKVDVRARGKTLVLNPGACGAGFQGRHTVAVVRLPGPSAEIVDLD